MRCAPGVLIDLTRPCPYWRWGVFTLSGFVSLTMLGWMLLHWQAGPGAVPVDGSPSMAPAALMLAVGGMALAAVTALLRAPVPKGQLLWNTVQWQWRDGPDSGSDPQPGAVRIAIDLGTWLLIAFEPLDAPHTTRWLPVARSTAGDAWHGLNCALRQGACVTPDPAQPTAGPSA